MTLITSPEDTVLRFLQTLREQGAGAAYEITSRLFQAAVSRGQFSEFISEYGVDSWVPRQMKADRMFKHRLIRFIGFVVNERGEEYGAIVFVDMDAGHWCVAGLSFRKRGARDRYRIPGHPLYTHVLAAHSDPERTP